MTNETITAAHIAIKGMIASAEAELLTVRKGTCSAEHIKGKIHSFSHVAGDAIDRLDLTVSPVEALTALRKDITGKAIAHAMIKAGHERTKRGAKTKAAAFNRGAKDGIVAAINYINEAIEAIEAEAMDTSEFTTCCNCGETIHKDACNNHGIYTYCNDCYTDYDAMTNYLESNFRNVGLNADFCFSAYKITSDLYVCDNEDDESVSIVKEVFTEDDRELQIEEDFYDLDSLQTYINKL